MSDFVSKPMSVSMFTNDKKTKDSQPMLTGKIRLGLKELAVLPIVEIEVDGEKVEVIDLDFSLWSKKNDKTGLKFWSGNCKKAWVKGEGDVSNSNDLPPHGADAPSVEQDMTGANGGGVDNDLPF